MNRMASTPRAAAVLWNPNASKRSTVWQFVRLRVLSSIGSGVRSGGIIFVGERPLTIHDVCIVITRPPKRICPHAAGHNDVVNDSHLITGKRIVAAGGGDVAVIHAGRTGRIVCST